MKIYSIVRLFIFLLAALILSGCQTMQGRSNAEDVEIIAADSQPDESALIDVWIQVFEPGPIDEDGKENAGITEEIRRSESRFIPIHLKNTLQHTGHWGAVRVVPQSAVGGELLVSGEIIKSDGEELTLHIRAVDSRGYAWLEKEYTSYAVVADYAANSRGKYDAFQDIYNAIANDLVIAKQGMSAETPMTIRQVAELRFASDLSPDAFKEHLNIENDQYQIGRLPAREDPMLQRVQTIRERDYMLIDTYNEYYDGYYREIWDPYNDWRQNRLEEAENLRRVEQEAMTRKVIGFGAMIGAIALSAAAGTDTQATADALSTAMIVGGVMIAKSGFDKDGEKQIHIDAMQELDNSFESEAAPMVVDVDGETHQLTGSVESQYAKWRELLHRIYLSETGLEGIEK
ncbi:MAG: hypothetical protein GY696_03545 [Gammaproteobacteria bacterium]|nr:hypothetical protein [Gammaproteobacteria bacterium]